MKSTAQKIKEYNQAGIDGTIADELNPAFLFNNISAQLLVKVLQEGLDLQEMILLSLKERGLNAEGKWVGYGK